MAYQEHGFVSGMKLTGTAMAEVDAQIAENARQIDALWQRVMEVPDEWLQSIRLLSLDMDTSTVRLNLRSGDGDKEETISVVELPDDSSKVPCTDLSVSASLGDLIVGDTAQITTSVTPINSTDRPYYLSADRDVAIVTTDGLVKAVGRGQTTITVACGSQTRTLTVGVTGTISLKGNIDIVNWLSMSGYGGVEGATYDCSDGGNIYFGLIPYDFDKYVIHSGEKFTFTLSGRWLTRPGFIVKAIAGQTPYINDMRDSDRYLISLVEQVASITRDVQSYSWINNTGSDCYFVCSFDCKGTDYDESMEDVDTYVHIMIGPAQ